MSKCIGYAVLGGAVPSFDLKAIYDAYYQRGYFRAELVRPPTELLPATATEV